MRKISYQDFLRRKKPYFGFSPPFPTITFLFPFHCNKKLIFGDFEKCSFSSLCFVASDARRLAEVIKQALLVLCFLTLLIKWRKNMSAFIVTKLHIDLIVTVLAEKKCYSIKKVLEKYNHDFDKIGQILLDENYRSVNYRYSENDKTPKYKFAKYKGRISIGQALKALDCLDYQSCECSDYDDSEAKEIITTSQFFFLNEIKCRDLEYQKSEWCIYD